MLADDAADGAITGGAGRGGPSPPPLPRRSRLDALEAEADGGGRAGGPFDFAVDPADPGRAGRAGAIGRAGLDPGELAAPPASVGGAAVVAVVGAAVEGDVQTDGKAPMRPLVRFFPTHHPSESVDDTWSASPTSSEHSSGSTAAYPI